ncbi:DNA polymerase II [Thalassolituus marinus]|uniref:DNA polymerase n=1 Tax=Thalassolituus marinus TaxID=671053 RepID=A0ABS7ZSJ0_9GAMM|nr:DNA polymerase II [Thalassolituus marinus]MCA6064723.1 DNA polymerase II [Thalassolituus marinus]
MTNAFLLTSSWHDDDQGTLLTFWWHTALGPLRQQIRQPAICFIDVSDTERARACAAMLNWPIDIREVGLRRFSGEPAAACYLPSAYLYRWRDVLQEQGIICRELDIRPTDRYLMERFVYGFCQLDGEFSEAPGGRYQTLSEGRMRAIGRDDSLPPLKILSLDIETSFPRKGQPDRLFSVGFYAPDFQRVLMIGNAAQTGEDLQLVEDERELLLRTLSLIAEYDPDVIIGWNVVQFDFEFLRRKYLEHDIPFVCGRDGSELQWRQSANNPDRIYMHIAGRVVLDGIELLRNATFQFESFALDDVATHFLQEGKLLHGEQRADDIEYLFAHDKPALAAYNLKDCELVWRIFVKADLMNFAIERSHMTGLLMDRMGGSVAAFENLYLPRLHRAGYVAPNIGEGYHEQKSPGGYVMDSRPGLFEHVLVLDFKSLYPSIIRTFKIDPMGLSEGMALPTSSVDTQQAVPGFFGGRFSQEKHILPELIRMLGEKRELAKKAGNKALSQAIKVIMASCYGVLGSDGCRFYDTRLSSSITKRGHEIILQSSQWIREQGYDVIYGDTDSVFVWLKRSVADDEADAIGKQLIAGLNQWWAEQLQQRFAITSYLEMEYETHYRRFFMPSIRGEETGSKKRYAGLISHADGSAEIIFKGLEAVRSDWTPLARAFQRELYRRIFVGEAYGDWLRAEVRSLLNGEKDDQLIYRKRLRRPLSAYQKNIPPHAQAAARLEQWLDMKGLPARFALRGGWIEYRITVNGPEPVWPDGSSGSAADYTHYLEKQIRPTADSVFQFTGDDFIALAGLQLSLF